MPVRRHQGVECTQTEHTHHKKKSEYRLTWWRTTQKKKHLGSPGTAADTGTYIDGVVTAVLITFILI